MQKVPHAKPEAAWPSGPRRAPSGRPGGPLLLARHVPIRVVQWTIQAGGEGGAGSRPRRRPGRCPVDGGRHVEGKPVEQVRRVSPRRDVDRPAAALNV
ncbi:MAG: hypothetical protein WKF75_01820 [Singulisphaera sp.]